MKKVTGYKVFEEWKRYLRQAKASICRKKDRALLMTIVPVMATVLISACGAEAYIPWIGLSVNNVFYVVLAYCALMNSVMWQIIAKPEMDMKDRLLLNVLPTELLLWLHLCRKDYPTAMMSAYIALGAIMIVAVQMLFCGYRTVLINWVCTSTRRAGLLVMLVMFVPSAFSACSQVRNLDQVNMLIANQSVWKMKERKNAKQRPKMSEDEWNLSSIQHRLDYLKMSLILLWKIWELKGGKCLLPVKSIQ